MACGKSDMDQEFGPLTAFYYKIYKQLILTETTNNINILFNYSTY